MPALAIPTSRRNVQNLYNDYVYFWRWSLWKLFENPEANGPGIISFISASSYLRGPGFVGMRQKMREAFDELWIIDLEGDNLGPRKTENVFAIQTPVAIAIGVRYGEAHPGIPARARYTKITGTREEKLAKLDAVRRFEDLDWQDCFAGWTQPILPRLGGDYFNWPLMTDIFPWQGCGAKYERNWPIAETRGQLETRWARLLAAPANQKPQLFKEDDDRKVNRSYQSLRDRRTRLPDIASLPAQTPPLEIVRYGWRSFDRQYALADNRVGGRLNPSLWLAHSDNQVYLTSLLTGVLGLGPAATLSAYIPDFHYFRGSFGGKDVIPLWRDTEGTRPNITLNLLTILSDALGQIVRPQDLFAYAYSVLATPAYVDKYSEELAVPGPRLPLTKDRNLFTRAVNAGRALIALHTFGERFLRRGQHQGHVPQGRARCTRGVPTSREHYPETYAYDPDTQILSVATGLFSPVSARVWDFTVSGLRVVESWLKYRMKEGAGRTSSPLDAIRPQRWSGEMTQELLELLWVLEATVNMLPELSALLVEIVSSDTFREGDLPKPTAAETQNLLEEESELDRQMNLDAN
jgi:hypothetical protein